MSEICGTVKRCEPLLVPLVNFRTIVQEVMELQWFVCCLLEIIRKNVKADIATVVNALEGATSNWSCP